jgi:preprotein translocase subunit SecE
MAGGQAPAESARNDQRCSGEDMATQLRGQRTEKRARAGGPGKRPRTTPAVFVREVIAELRKVIWPTRRELRTYTIVAMVFIVVMVVIVTSLDYGFTKLVLAAFG